MRTRRGSYDELLPPQDARSVAVSTSPTTGTSNGADTSTTAPDVNAVSSGSSFPICGAMFSSMFLLQVGAMLLMICAAAAEMDANYRRRQLLDNTIISEAVADACRGLFSKKRRASDEGGAPSKRRYVRWDRERAHRCVLDDYMGPMPRFADRQFERIFRITRSHAEYILQRLATADSFWRPSVDAIGNMANAPVVKLLAALKLLCYGVSFSAFQAYFQMGESTARLCLSKLTKGLLMTQIFDLSTYGK